MSKRKMTPLATALTVVDELNDQDRATLADYLRVKMPKVARPKSSTVPHVTKKSKPKSQPAETQATADLCAVPACDLPQWAPVHSSDTDGFHIFRQAIRTKGAGA